MSLDLESFGSVGVRFPLVSPAHGHRSGEAEGCDRPQRATFLSKLAALEAERLTTPAEPDAVSVEVMSLGAEPASAANTPTAPQKWATFSFPEPEKRATDLCASCNLPRYAHDWHIFRRRTSGLPFREPIR